MTEEIVTEEKKQPNKAIQWVNVGIFFSTLGIIILICAFGYGYFQLSKVNILLASTVGHLQKQSAADKLDIATLQKSVVDLQQNTQKWQEISNQQTHFVAEWRAAQKGI